MLLHVVDLRRLSFWFVSCSGDIACFNVVYRLLDPYYYFSCRNRSSFVHGCVRLSPLWFLSFSSDDAACSKCASNSFIYFQYFWFVSCDVIHSRIWNFPQMSKHLSLLFRLLIGCLGWFLVSLTHHATIESMLSLHFCFVLLAPTTKPLLAW